MSEAVSYPTQQPLNNPSKKSKIPLIVVIGVIAAIIGIFIFRQPKKTNDTTKTTVTKSQEPSPTEEPTVDKGSVNIQVLNGTGTPGQAGKVVDVLKDAGYDSDNIKTDNADEFSSTITSISAKEGFSSIAKNIKSDLESTFDEINISSTALEENSEYDIIITTGGKKYEEETTATPSPTSSESPTETPTPTPTVTPTPTP